MNTAWLYHLDSSVCVDHWSCRELDHTSVPPRCGAQATDRSIGCELPQGHPGPHLPSKTGNAGSLEAAAA